MIINSIIIYDYMNGKINQFNFKSHTNILVSEANIVGKSSLMKSIYYCLGYSVKIWPQNWDIQNMMFQIKITNQEREHTVTRHKKLFYIDGRKIVLNEKEYSKWLQDLLNIEIKLKDKKGKFLSDVYASEVLMPFYIDQDKSWDGYLYSKSSDSFARYSNIVRNVLDFYFQISDHFLNDLELQKRVLEAELSNIQKKIEALTLLESEYEPSLAAETIIANNDKINSLTMKYLEKINRLNNSVSPINNEIIEIDSKINELSRDISELDKLKKSYKSRISEINYECIHCNSKLTVDQSLTRLRVRNNLHEIENQINTNKYDRTKLEEQKRNILLTKNSVIDTISKTEGIVKESKEFNSIENYIEEQVNQKIAHNYLSVEQKLINEQYEKTSSIKEVSKEIAKVKRLGAQKRSGIKKRYFELINEYERHFEDVKLDDIEFYIFKEVKGSGMDSNKKLLALYTLYSNLISEFSKVKIPFAMDSFIKNESSSELREKMFSFLSKYYLSIEGQSFFSIIKENVKYLEQDENEYHFVDLKKPILKDIDETNGHLIKAFDIL
ncbi:hypothetical protein [Paenibacillus peoriae]|uniref:hypothetical protein n=1 Tax=Paenibacillus peoriae TaxID=59893 RepID=UPI00208F4C98|nr:hypothetical protein [Paenibacillus peoriae]